MVSPHWWRWTGGVMLSFFIASCSTLPSGEAPKNLNSSFWSGRISLVTSSPRPQRVTASFELSGSPQAGTLKLSSPLGTTLAMARWTPDEAVLDQGGQTFHYPDAQALTTAALGQPLPLAMVFAWLAGQPASAEGWTPDLLGLPQGRLGARQQGPSGDAEVRIVLDEPPR